MALSTYTELQTAVANWLNRTDLTDRVPEFIALAEAQMNRRLRVRQMVTRSEATVSSEFVADPGDVMEPISLTLEISESDIRKIEYLAPDRLLKMKAAAGTQTGEPQFWSFVDGELQVLPTPDASYTFELTYYAKIPPLASNSTNWLLTLYPDAYLYGALLQGSPYLIDDERAVTWGAMFRTALADIQMSDRVPSGKLRSDLVGLIDRQSFNINTGI